MANVAGAGWSAALQFLSVPLVAKLIGVEAYGLVGFFTTLQVSLQMLDLGFSATINRELARFSSRAETANAARDLLRTMELVYWGIGICIGMAIVMLAPTIARHWLQASHMDAVELKRAVELIGAVIALQWPLSFYQGGLAGLQQMVRLNALRIGAATLSTGGGLLVLWLVEASIRSYFLWLILASATQVLATAAVLWVSMPTGTRRGRFDHRRLFGVARFAAGTGGITALGTVLSQMDKIVLSRILPLEQFGFYSLAVILASSLTLFISPVFSASYPRLSEVVARGGAGSISEIYHQLSQVMACLILPAAGLLIAFAPMCLLTWTGNGTVAESAALILVLLVVGTTINGLMHLPYALQLAYGWTQAGLSLSICNVVLFAPMMVWSAVNFGAVGGAAIWALLNIFHLAVGLPLTHRRLLRGEMRVWLLRDVGYPLVAVTGVMLAARGVVDTDATGSSAVLQLATVASFALLAAAFSSSFICSNLKKLVLQARLGR